jgi:alkanesulfonate monooxygenase SsuD/methylene tetrahydromethanopterin reductase-like flavin-dependent oxidoreductase (luciferase family)
VWPPLDCHREGRIETRAFSVMVAPASREGNHESECEFMRVGVSLLFQNYADFDRSMRGQFQRPPVVPDAQIYEEDLRLGHLAEPLGFDSMWAPEHHFGPFCETCNVLQLLSYFAGRTERLDMGTMVVVLPWHNPLRVAEEISILDNLLGDRRLLLGFGRGMAEMEFNGFQVSRDESRGRMQEAFEIIRLALTQERFSYDGAFFQFPEVGVRPRPRTPDLSENFFGAWSGPDSMRYWASTGVGQMFNFAATWENAAAQSEAFNAARAEYGWDPVEPLGAIYVYCAETEAQAREVGRKWAENVMDAGIQHYKLLQVPEVVKMFMGNESADGGRPSDDQMRAALKEGFVNSAVIGTPDRVCEKMFAIQRMVNHAEFMCHFKYGAMPYDEAEQSMRLFAREVLPALHEIPTTTPRATPFSVVQGTQEAETIA